MKLPRSKIPTHEVTEVFHAARALDPSSRSTFLDAACAGRDELRAAVEAMFASDGETVEGVPSLEVAGEGPRLQPGTMVGSYRIEALIGAGGMGEVYRASDLRLGRDVAVKVLSGLFLLDPGRRGRLDREAKLLAALNHPRIAAIYDLAEVDGAPALVLELVEGRSLSDRLDGGPLPVAEAVALGGQIAEALEAAHLKGIVHRDLKPANIKLARDGTAKVLDFGVAKVATPTSPGLTRARLAAADETSEGSIVGTVAYMSPEQVRGRAVDRRSDLWALGCVLYEMLTARQPFRGETPSDTMAAILGREPDWTALPSGTPPPLRDLLRRCLQKDPQRRPPDEGGASEVRASLASLPKAGISRWSSGRGPSGRRRWMAAVAVLALGAVVATLEMGGVRTRLPGERPPIRSLAVLPLENLSGDPGQDYFADGMTEALITDLGQLGGLERVIARGSVVRYKGTTRPLAEIARELEVEALVTGAVLRAGDRIRVTAQLIDAARDEQLWASRYEREASDVLVLQNELTRAIAREIEVKLSPEEQTRLSGGRRVDPAAHEAYLKGQFYLDKLSPDSFDTALEHFRVALEKDPAYALAHLGVERVWTARSHMGLLPTAEAIPHRRAALSRALELDPGLAEAHVAQAALHVYGDWDWAAAGRSLRRASELKSRAGCIASVDFLLVMGRRDEARAELDRCLAIDPLNVWTQTAYGGRLLRLGRHAEGIVQLQKAVKAEPNLGLAHRYLWVAFHAQGLDEQAVAEARTAFTLAGHDDVAQAALAGFREGGYARAMTLAAERLAAHARTEYIQPTQVAALLAYAGDLDGAFEWLERGFQVQDSWMIFLKDDPRFASLRRDPRFAALLRRMGIPTQEGS